MSESMLMSCEFSKWWLDRDKMMVVFVLFMAMFLPFARGDDPQLLQTPPHQTNFQWALMNISYVDYATKKEYSKPLRGYFGKQSLIASISGVVIHAVNVEDRAGTQVVNHYGCTPYSHKKFPSETWIALVERGSCSFANKIHVATKEHNASAIVIYNDVSVTIGPIIMDHDKAPGSIAVMLLREEGQEIVGFIEKGYTVYMQMKPGSIDSFTTAMQNNISKTSVLFVSISFVVLMVVSLAWLIFYYVQRFRYSHAKERLARRLTCAAKKAITKIPQRTLKTGDKELDSEYDPCAICIESYKFHEVIRILPCRHVFHKSCVDPWLLDQRSCPMCKLDILRAYGMQVGGSQESLHPAAETGRVVAPNPEEPELNSSIEYNHPNEATIMLVSDTCLHFCGGTSERTDDNEKVDDDSRGAVGGIHKSSSLSSLSSKGSSHTRAGKTDKAGSVNSEKRALIKKEPEEKRSWKSDDVFSSPDDSDGKKISKDGDICVARIELEMGDVEKRETSQP
ncbi:unnamed protein product [Candidula unifasciata]|uniref:RING-type domain-containing protein n=1 Tax=Candidula unifasciata TaxID=100452 RepID=A0A8S3ZBQ7_9EUPU|nr:unnamed protein product [Candidula unifasciata]